MTGGVNDLGDRSLTARDRQVLERADRPGLRSVLAPWTTRLPRIPLSANMNIRETAKFDVPPEARLPVQAERQTSA